jgi:AGZA family xanthine/uracil permease-like MFS transporter
MSQHSFDPPWFVRKDLDGFFGLMIDNQIQLILIVSLSRELIHLPDSYIFGRILPGAAISILVGNVFYAWQARQLARETGREDVTALPYGINTVSLFAFVFFIMLPIYQETKDPVWAWKIGLVACFLNGIIEIICAFIAESVRRVTPRAALLSALAASLLHLFRWILLSKSLHSLWLLWCRWQLSLWPISRTRNFRLACLAVWWRSRWALYLDGCWGQ